MKVQYLLVRPGTGIVKAMKKFSETDLNGKGHMLSVFALEDTVDLPDDPKRLADFLVTYHPNLISWPGDGESTNRAMWLEGKHLPGKDVSHDNRWVPPRSMSYPVSRSIGGSATWEDTFLHWDKALDNLQQYMVLQ